MYMSGADTALADTLMVIFDDQALSITIEDPLVITTTSLPDGKDSTAYSQTLSATVLVGALLVLLFYLLVGGRGFCAWVWKR